VSKPKASTPKKPAAPADDEETFALIDDPKKGSGSGKGSKKGDKKGDSALDLASDDDELVLGGSGPGSDVTLRPGDSGISLLDPASDSGLSLDAPIELGGAGQELALGQEADFDSDSVMELKADDDFLLTPLEEGGDEDSSDSGSQVI